MTDDPRRIDADTPLSGGSLGRLRWKYGRTPTVHGRAPGPTRDYHEPTPMLDTQRALWATFNGIEAGPRGVAMWRWLWVPALWLVLVLAAWR